MMALGTRRKETLHDTSSVVGKSDGIRYSFPVTLSPYLFPLRIAISSPPLFILDIAESSRTRIRKTEERR